MELEKEFYLYRADGERIFFCRLFDVEKYIVEDLLHSTLRGGSAEMEKRELLKFKATHGALFEYELGDQMSIFDL